MTPPEVLALGRPDGAPADSPGWTVRVVPNKFPAIPGQEVVIHGPAHIVTLRGRPGRTWSQRRQTPGAARRDAHAAGGAAWTMVAVNEGPAAGASLDHSHSQIVPFPEVPPVVAAQTDRLRRRLRPLCGARDRGRAHRPARRRPPDDRAGLEPVRLRALDRSRRPHRPSRAGRSSGRRSPTRPGGCAPFWATTSPGTASSTRRRPARSAGTGTPRCGRGSRSPRQPSWAPACGSTSSTRTSRPRSCEPMGPGPVRGLAPVVGRPASPPESAAPGTRGRPRWPPAASCPCPWPA